MTREQLAAFLYRYAQFKGLDLKANSDLSDFSDSDRVSKWAEEALRWAVGQGVLSTSDGRLNPRGGVTAGEMDAALARLPK